MPSNREESKNKKSNLTTEIRKKKDLNDKYHVYRKKMNSSLLPLIDEKFLPSGQNIENYLNTMQKIGQFLPAGSSIPNKGIHVPANLVCLEISLSESNSRENINQYTWLVLNHSNKYQLTIAWVKVDELIDLARLEAVRFIRPVMPPVLR